MYTLLNTFDYRVVEAMLVVASIVLILLRLSLTVLAIKLLWRWIIPDLFPGMIAQGKVAGDMSYKTALKMVAGLAILMFLYNPSTFFNYAADHKQRAVTASIQGPESKGPAKGMAISIDKSRNQALISSLRQGHKNIAESEIAVCLVGKDAPDEVLKCLDWAVVNGVKVIEMDGAANDIKDSRVAEKMKSMGKAGFYIGSVRFA